MSITDSIIAVWDAKYHYGYWRPITAIQLADTDGNPDTVVDPAWEPLVATPPYPDYVSGFNGVTGALTRSVSRILGHGRVDLYIRPRRQASRAITGSPRRSTETGSTDACGSASTSVPPTRSRSA
jgi:hypothetical protein